MDYDDDTMKSLQAKVSALTPDPIKYANKISIKQLESLLRQLSNYYYNTNEELVSDVVFDDMLGVLEERDPGNKFFKEVGAPITKNAVLLPYSMPSLDKIKPTSDKLERWLNKFKGPYMTSDKLDGVSGMVYKSKDRLILYTRGDGVKGQDISHLIKHVIPNYKKILSNMPDKAAARGELIISKSDFKKHLKCNYKNVRNAVAGLVNSTKDYPIEVAKFTRFVAYAVVHPRLKQSDQFNKLSEWGYLTVNHKIDKKLTLDTLSKRLIDRRDNGEYDVDGIVVGDNSTVYAEDNISNPDHAFAFKMVLKDQVATATIIDVVWSPSMHGYLKPKIKIKPIDLGGVTITSATAFHAKFVKENNLGPGSVIKLVRSGDVIPHILEVLKPSTSGKPKMPSVEYKWDATGTNIIVKDIHGAASDSIMVKRITQFFKVLDVKYISEGIVAILVDNGYNTILKVLKVIHDNPDKLSELDRIGNKLVVKIKANLDAAMNTVTLAQLIASSTIMGPGLSVKRIQVIIDAYPNIMNETWDKATMIEKISSLEGFHTKTATLFTSNFDKFKVFFDKVNKIYKIDRLKKGTTPKATAKKGMFLGQSILFTGFRDKDLKKLIEDEGGEVVERVSKTTTLVVYANTEGSKYKKAQALSIKTMPKDEFIKKYSK